MSEDRAAFAALFEANFDRCALVARRIVLDKEAADEIAAEAFTRAWARWPRVRRHPAPTAWLMRVTTNLALDHTRKRRHRPPLPLAATPPDEVAVLNAALVAALRKLPARQQAAIALRYLADLPEQEVAAAMGVSTGSVKTHVHRGLAKLRSIMGTDEEQVEAGLVS